MGRRQHLTRLALGRSPYQDDCGHDGGSSWTPPVLNDNAGSIQVAQQYNSKGRPINPTVELESARMRDAQNSVLALVGVVEDRSNKEQDLAKRAKYIKQEQQKALAAENDIGEELDLAASIARSLFLWFAQSLMMRFQIGIFDSKLSFMDVVSMELRESRGNGWKGIVSVLVPGAPSYLLRQILRSGLGLGVELTIDFIQKFVIRQRGLRYKTARVLRRMCDVFLVATMAMVDIILLPLEYHTILRMTGLSPTLPWLPPLQSLLPWSPLSLHRYGWQQCISTPILRYAAVPGVLILSRTVLSGSIADETSILPWLTSFRYPAINESINLQDTERGYCPRFLQDPLGYTLQQALELRMTFTSWCGWNMINNEKPRHSKDATFDSDTIPEKQLDHTVLHHHRATSLAHMVPTFLATSIDQLFHTVFLLPFDVLTVRVVAATFMNSSFPKSQGALHAKQHLSRPFNAWMYSSSDDAVTNMLSFENYASKIGLCLALQAFTHTMLLAGIYRTTRNLGVRSFNWGSSCKTETVSYEASDQEER